MRQIKCNVGTHGTGMRWKWCSGGGRFGNADALGCGGGDRYHNRTDHRHDHERRNSAGRAAQDAAERGEGLTHSERTGDAQPAGEERLNRIG